MNDFFGLRTMIALMYLDRHSHTTCHNLENGMRKMQSVNIVTIVVAVLIYGCGTGRVRAFATVTPLPMHPRGSSYAWHALSYALVLKPLPGSLDPKFIDTHIGRRQSQDTHSEL